MAQKLLKAGGKRKVAAKRPDNCVAAASSPSQVVLVGTYREKQLDWIKKNGVYNYPIKDENDGRARTHHSSDFASRSDPCGSVDMAAPQDGNLVEFASKVKELWLYAGAKAKRHCFAAEFVGIQSKDEFLAANPTYVKKVGKPGHAQYAVFKTKPFDYGPKLEGKTVVARAIDFASGRGQTKKVAAAIRQFHADGEFAPLAAYLPAELAQVPRQQLRVCEAAVQLDFFPVMGDCVSQNVPFPPPKNPKFTFVDLFAGIGGFHLAMHQLGGKCVFACEWDKDAQETYAKNYGIAPAGDITKINERDIPTHDVLCAGFPCQAFSKAGKQLGFADETKGTLFFDVERILAYHRTKYIVLENVRNLVSHDDGNTWRTIYSHLVELGYRLTPEPLIVSPHYFGIPQLRERVVVLGVYDPAHAKTPLKIKLPRFRGKSECSLDTILEKDNRDPSYKLTDEEVAIIDIWDEFYHGIKEKVIGFPVWLDWFKTPPPPSVEMPEWKRAFVKKNNQLYLNNKKFIDAWLEKHGNLVAFTPTMRKMEWQCGESVGSAWEAFMQQRPSGLRIKRPDCAPALVAIVQVPIIGKYKRRMTVLEAARLQSFDDNFIPCTNRHQAYKQFGNAVNVTVIRECARRLFEYE